MDWPKFAMRCSLAVAVLMLVGKISAYIITGSAAILSDAAESVVHIFATGIAVWSLWFSQRPVSQKHPYGHGKVAYFSAGFEGALIFCAALLIVYQSVIALIYGAELQQLGWGLLITGALTLVNLILGFGLIHIGKKHNTLILVANGKHVLTDMWTSVGVLIGVGLVWITGILWLDPLVALALGINILYSGFKLIYQAFRGLLDEADPEMTETILGLLREAREAGHIQDYHQLRHRVSNDLLWIQVHILVEGNMVLDEAHAQVTRIEEQIEAAFPKYKVQITTHLEPKQHQDAHPKGHESLEDPFSYEG